MRIAAILCHALTIGTLVTVIGTSLAAAQGCGDPNGDGRVTVSDGVDVLRAGAGLSSACSVAVCDVDGNGTVAVTDGVLVLRAAADLPTVLACHIDARQACLAAMRGGNLEAAAGVCATAAGAAPDDAEIRAFADTSSAVVATFASPELTAMLDAFGFRRAGSAADICNVVVQARRGRPPAGAPRTGAAVATLRQQGLELIDRLLAAAAAAPSEASFPFSCPELAEEGIVAEIDYGDLLVARYELEFSAALIHLAAAYDLDFDPTGSSTNGLRFRDVFVGNPSLFVLHGGGAAELGLARNHFDAALTSFVAAVDFIAAETDDQSDDLFVIGPADAAAAARERAGAVRLRQALNGTARFEDSTFDLPRDQRVTLDRFLDGKLTDLRPLVPGFDGTGNVNLCLVGDPTFGGILPDLETDERTGCLDPGALDFVGGRFGPFLPMGR